MRRTKHIRSTLLSMGAASTLGIALLANPAAAGPPQTEVFGPFTFPDVNACTGEENLVTVTFTVKSPGSAHEMYLTHGDFTTDDGYVGTVQGRTNVDVFNGNIVKSTLNVRLANGETGGVIRIHEVFVLDERTGEVRVDQGANTCVRPPG